MGYWSIKDIDRRRTRDREISDFIKSMTDDEKGTALYKLMRSLEPSAVNEAFKLLKTELLCDEKGITKSVMQKWW